MKNNYELVNSLIKLYIPADKLDNYFPYVQRILTSKFAVNSGQDNKQFMNIISRRMISEKYEKFSILKSKLDKNPQISKKTEILLMLFKLNDDKSGVLPGPPMPDEKVTEYVPQVVAASQVSIEKKASLESVFIRDVLFTFQGIEGKYLNYSNLEDKFIIRHEIKDSVKYTLEKLSEVG